jgi:hypothetical protein
MFSFENAYKVHVDLPGMSDWMRRLGAARA